MSAETVLASAVALVTGNGSTSGYVIKDYFDDKLTVDNWRTGTVEFDFAPEFDRESELYWDGLDRLQHSFQVRISKATAGDHSTARAAVMNMMDQVKNALESDNNSHGNLGHGYVQKWSLAFGRPKWSPPTTEGVSLSKRSVTLPFGCIEYQVPGSRS